MARRSVLVVGAGCVGQVFGQRLSRGGASVTFFVREKYRAGAVRGFTLFPLNGARNEPPAEHFTDFRLISSPAEVAAQRFDQVYMTVSSDAVREAWLTPFLEAVGDATVIALQPSRDDLAIVLAASLNPAAVLAGSIGLVSYGAPLAGETRFVSDGTAYWFPPLARSMVSGSPERVREVVAALRGGGLPVHAVTDVHTRMALTTAVGMAFLNSLEAAGWSTHRLIHEGPRLERACAAMREVVPIVAGAEGKRYFGVCALLRPSIVRLTLAIGARFAPFPLEPYLTKHFDKVAKQTHLIVAGLIARGERHGLPTSSLREARLPSARVAGI